MSKADPECPGNLLRIKRCLERGLSMEGIKPWEDMSSSKRRLWNRRAYDLQSP